MSLFTQYSLGIEIAENQAILLALKSGSKSKKIVAHEIIPLDVSASISERMTKLGDLVNTFYLENNLQDPQILISIPTKKTILRKVSFPYSVKENLKETMRYEVEKYTPYSISEIYFDSLIVEERKKEGFIDVLLMVSRKKDLDPYFSLQNHIGALHSVEVASSLLASSLGHNSKIDWQDKTTLLVHIESTKVYISLITNSHLIDSQSVAIDEKQSTASILSERIDSLCAKHEVKPEKQNSYYLTDGSYPEIENTVIDEISLQPFPLPEGIPSEKLLKAYYLALKGQRLPAEGINLLPEKLRKKQTKTALYLSLTLIGLIILLLVGVVGSQVAQNRMIKERFSSEEKRLSIDAKGISSIEEKLQIIEKRLSLLIKEDRKASATLDTLNELSLLLPDSAYVKKFYLKENSVRIEGAAETATELISNIEASDFFSNVSFLSTLRKDKSGKELFSIGFTLSDKD